MSYTINRYNGTQIAVVADGTIDATLDLKLIGKNYAGYGAVQNENFVYLLENFANTTQPPKPLPGQLWYDSGNSKLKFYDGSKFRTTGGAEIGATAPSGLTVGDFWYDNLNQQLYAFNGTTYTLIGPQAKATSGTTEMRSKSVVDTSGTTHSVIQAIDNGNVIFVISSDSDFTLDGTINPITGFNTIHQGVTLCYTNNGATPGQTTSSHRFYGTATNADRLGGLTASNFVQAGSAGFTNLVNFADVGFTVGNPQQRLKVFNDGAAIPTIANQIDNKIVFQTTISSVTKTPMVLNGNDVLPGSTLTSNLGSSGLQWATVYANYFQGTAAQADKLMVDATARTASVAPNINTVAVRDGTGQLKATFFEGTATAANYADLAEKYLADTDYEVGTVVMIGGEKEVTACQVGSRAIGAISENPAFMMNKDLEGGTYIALKGRVPVKVTGMVKKGQRLVAGQDGTAQAAFSNTADVFAVALESNDDNGVKIVECIIL